MWNAVEDHLERKDMLLKAVTPDEDAASFLERVNSRRSAWPPRPRALLLRLPPLFSRLNYGWGPLPRNAVEVYGMSNSGKTEMLLSLVAALVTPRKWGGLSMRVAFFDNTFKLDLARLAELIRSRAQCWGMQQQAHLGRGGDSTRARPSEVEAVVTEALESLIVFRCESTMQFLATLASLKRGAVAAASASASSLNSDEAKFGAIFVDSLVPFFHGDKVFEKAGGAHVNNIVCRALRSAVLALGAVAFVVSPALYARSYGDGERGAWGRRNRGGGVGGSDGGGGVSGGGDSGRGGGRSRGGTGYNSAAVRGLYHKIEQAPVSLSHEAKSVLFPLLPRLTQHAACLDRCWEQLFTHRIVLTRLEEHDAAQVRGEGAGGHRQGRGIGCSPPLAMALVTTLREGPRQGTPLQQGSAGPGLTKWKRKAGGGGQDGTGGRRRGARLAGDVFFAALGVGTCQCLA